MTHPSDMSKTNKKKIKKIKKKIRKANDKVARLSRKLEKLSGVAHVPSSVDAPFGVEAPFNAEPFNAEPFNAEPFNAEPFNAEPFKLQELDVHHTDTGLDNLHSEGLPVYKHRVKTSKKINAIFRQPTATSHCRFLHSYQLTIEVEFVFSRQSQGPFSASTLNRIRPHTQTSADEFIDRFLESKEASCSSNAAKAEHYILLTDADIKLCDEDKEIFELLHGKVIQMGEKFSLEILAHQLSTFNLLFDADLRLEDFTLREVHVCISEHEGNSVSCSAFSDPKSGAVSETYGAAKNLGSWLGNSALTYDPDTKMLVPLGAVEVTIEARSAELNENNWVIDFGSPSFKIMKEVFKYIFDHKTVFINWAHLNDARAPSEDVVLKTIRKMEESALTQTFPSKDTDASTSAGLFAALLRNMVEGKAKAKLTRDSFSEAFCNYFECLFDADSWVYDEKGTPDFLTTLSKLTQVLLLHLEQEQDPYPPKRVAFRVQLKTQSGNIQSTNTEFLEPPTT